MDVWFIVDKRSALKPGNQEKKSQYKSDLRVTVTEQFINILKIAQKGTIFLRFYELLPICDSDLYWDFLFQGASFEYHKQNIRSKNNLTSRGTPIFPCTFCE